jgi:hypothetical protein
MALLLSSTYVVNRKQLTQTIQHFTQMEIASTMILNLTASCNILATKINI